MLARGDGSQLLSGNQKTPTRRHQAGKQTVNAFYLEMLIFFPSFPPFLQAGVGRRAAVRQHGKEVPCRTWIVFPCPTRFQQFAEK